MSGQPPRPEDPGYDRWVSQWQAARVRSELEAIRIDALNTKACGSVDHFREDCPPSERERLLARIAELEAEVGALNEELADLRTFS